MFKKEYLIERGLFSLTIIMAITIVLLLIFIVLEAIPAFDSIGVSNFIFGLNWSPDNNEFGVFPMIVGSFCITFAALIIAVPLSISCAIFLEEIAPVNLKIILNRLSRHWLEFHRLFMDFLV